MARSLPPLPPTAPEESAPPPPSPPRPPPGARPTAPGPGQSPPLRRRSFDWKWVFAGVAFMVLGHLAGYWLLHPLIKSLLYRQGRILEGASLMALLAMGIYFTGGLLVGRMSKGITVQEPAVAGVLGITMVFVLQLSVGMVNIIGLVFGAPFCYVVAYLGGLLGERWQSWSRRRVAARAHGAAQRTT